MKLNSQQYQDYQTLSILERLILAEFNINTGQEEPIMFFNQFYDISPLEDMFEIYHVETGGLLRNLKTDITLAIRHLHELELF